jgi:hypothetical protein
MLKHVKKSMKKRKSASKKTQSVDNLLVDKFDEWFEKNQYKISACGRVEACWIAFKAGHRLP